MTNFDNSTAQPEAVTTQAGPSLWMADDDLVTFSPPARSSSGDIEALVRRNPLTALLVAVGFGVVIGKLLR